MVPDRAGESAAFPVFEAVLVAILILTTILFFTSLQRPTTATDEGGIDLARLASDTLRILQTKTLSAPSCVSAAPLEQWVGLVMNNTPCVANAAEKFLDEVLPPGTQFQLRLDNGVQPMVLVPYQDTDVPRAGKAAATYINPYWKAYGNKNPAQGVYPGQEITSALVNATAMATTINCIEAPTGKSVAADGTTWVSRWKATPTHVPNDALYGVWAGYSTASATPDCAGSPTMYLFVGLPDGSTTHYPMYGLQLVVWFGA